MDNNVSSALEDLRVPTNHLQNGHGPIDIDCSIPNILTNWSNYSTLISWIAQELKHLCSEVNEVVTPIMSSNSPSSSSQQDISSFKMELSSLLKELGCPYSTLLEVPLSSRFENVQDRLILLNFLLSELQASRMIHIQKSKALNNTSGGNKNISLDESPTAKLLRELISELELGKPPDGTTEEAVWKGILPKVKGRIGNVRMEPLLIGTLSQTQWNSLDNYFNELKSDYTMRREMLLKRLDVTIQSFTWSDRFKDKEEKISGEFKKLRERMVAAPGVVLSDVLAARSDLPIIEKTSSTSVRKNTRSAVNSVVIGRVPDRGGRPDEVEPPPPEMPSWQQRQAPPASSGWLQNPNQRGGGGGDRGGRGCGRGGSGPRGGGGGSRVQGGWSAAGQQQSQYAGGGGGHGQGNFQSNNFQSQHTQQQTHNYGGGGGGGYQQQGGGGYYQHDDRQDNYSQGGGDYYNQGDYQSGGRGGHRGRGGGGYNQDSGGNYRGGRNNRRC